MREQQTRGYYERKNVSPFQKTICNYLPLITTFRQES
jgi:hypothetical protein